MAKIIDGKKIAADTREKIRNDVADFIAATGITPGLAVVIVGTDPGSQVYVRNKHKACTEAGMYSRVVELPEPTTQDELDTERLSEYLSRFGSKTLDHRVKFLRKVYGI